MCVAHGRAALFDRTAFLGVMAAAALPLALGTGAMAEAADTDRFALPPVPARLSRGNARAARIARSSPFVRATYARVEALARTIDDSALHDSIVAFLHDPTPKYARRYATPESRIAVRDALAGAGFVKAGDPVDGIFPPGTEMSSAFAVQPFWSTPGSAEGSHHAYPGGLAVHEYFNATMATQFAETYDRVYFDAKATIDRDTVIAAALYHDIMKTVVFQYRDDGSITGELTIAGTGAHHILSGAEAIAHGRSASFVTTLLSAHAAPSLGDETHVTDWCRAAAIVAGVDPVDYGLVKRDGSAYRLATDPAPMESFVNYLSDHDYVISVHAAHVVGERLKTRYAATKQAADATFPWYRAAVLSQASAIALYDTLARSGEPAFGAAVQRAEASSAS